MHSIKGLMGLKIEIPCLRTILAPIWYIIWYIYYYYNENKCNKGGNSEHLRGIGLAYRKLEKLNSQLYDYSFSIER